jgi:hypothetical protein
MFQVYLLVKGQWIEHGEPVGSSRKIVAQQVVAEGHALGTWKIRKAA